MSERSLSAPGSTGESCKGVTISKTGGIIFFLFVLASGIAASILDQLCPLQCTGHAKRSLIDTLDTFNGTSESSKEDNINSGKEGGQFNSSLRSCITYPEQVSSHIQDSLAALDQLYMDPTTGVGGVPHRKSSHSSGISNQHLPSPYSVDTD